MARWREKDFENWLCSPAEEGGRWRLWDVLGDNIPEEGERQAQRQVTTGAGRIDILISSPGCLSVIELKAKAATGDDLAQVLHYKAWLQTRAIYHSLTYPDAQSPIVLPFLIAPCFNSRIQAAANMAKVTLLQVMGTWELDEVWDSYDDCLPQAWDDKQRRPDALIVRAFTDTVTTGMAEG